MTLLYRAFSVKIYLVLAGVLESADRTDSKSVAFTGVWVQVPPPAPTYYHLKYLDGFFLESKQLLLN